MTRQITHREKKGKSDCETPGWDNPVAALRKHGYHVIDRLIVPLFDSWENRTLNGK